MMEDRRVAIVTGQNEAPIVLKAKPQLDEIASKAISTVSLSRKYDILPVTEKTKTSFNHTSLHGTSNTLFAFKRQFNSTHRTSILP
jgi:hypothetical protein